MLLHALLIIVGIAGLLAGIALEARARQRVVRDVSQVVALASHVSDDLVRDAVAEFMRRTHAPWDREALERDIVWLEDEVERALQPGIGTHAPPTSGDGGSGAVIWYTRYAAEPKHRITCCAVINGEVVQEIGCPHDPELILLNHQLGHRCPCEACAGLDKL